MLNLNTPLENSLRIASKFKEIRIDYNLTQRDLSARSKVSLGTLRRFETTGRIALESLMKLAAVLDLSDVMIDSLENASRKAQSLDEMLKQKNRPRVRAYAKKVKS
jgi:transcriptional regulator with XRE-family HTH domain